MVGKSFSELQGFWVGVKKAIEYKNLYAQWTLYDFVMIFIYVLVFTMIDTTRSTWFYLAYILVINYAFMMPSWKMQEMAEDIRKGDLIIYLTKPINYLLFRFFYFLGLDVRALAFLAVVILIFYPIANVIVFILLLPLLFLLEFLMMSSIAMISFWIYEIKHIRNISDNIKYFLTGSILPYTFFPENIRQIMDLIPYAYIGYLKVDILLYGTETLSKTYFMGLIINLILFSIICYTLWKQGLKKFEAQGG